MKLGRDDTNTIQNERIVHDIKTTLRFLIHCKENINLWFNDMGKA